ncbi:YjcQ protein [Fictibacillus enclensis]|uniref:YjcQ protein n=1 Tax=Fictibacillus enclensis TaxID=1017270 RepID=A0A0V8J8Y9_9BACL|nr:YjcQ family protein [Fictibacillus enclensis]KSU83429.1 hypothetical protein AS030_12755 [Fictibacillus enclensis]SCC15319.1 YjcQ protein [Fictibacillus enclensis]
MNKKKLRFAILKEIDAGNAPLNEHDFSVSEEEFDEAINFLTREKYLIGITWGDNRPIVSLIGPIVTEKGETYLEENSLLAKAYKGLKEAREWIKL